MGLTVWLILTLTIDPHPTALEIHVVRPDIQLKRFLDLFEGTGQAGPAEVLASWRRAEVPSGPNPPGKTAQALLTLLNSRMVAEFRTLDGMRIWVDPPTFDEGAWCLVIPQDDGTLAAFASALSLTDGSPGAPVLDLQTDRLAGPGSPWMSRDGQTIVVAADRKSLARGWVLWKAVRPTGALEPGYHARLDFQALAESPNLSAGRWGAALTALGLQDLALQAGIRQDSLRLEIRSRLDHADRPPSASVDPEWLDYVPENASAAFSCAFSPSGEDFNRLFLAADRYLQTLDAEPPPAPIRARLNLMANLAGVRPEVEVWPHLRGLSAFVFAGPGGGIEKAAVVLHTDSETSARSLADRVLPRLLKTLGRSEVARADGVSVLIGPDEDTVASLAHTHQQPLHSAGQSMRARWNAPTVSRCGTLWPGRWPGWIGEPTLDEALKSAPPLVWQGRREGAEEVDRLEWPDLRATVARWVVAVPGTQCPR